MEVTALIVIVVIAGIVIVPVLYTFLKNNKVGQKEIEKVQHHLEYMEMAMEDYNPEADTKKDVLAMAQKNVAELREHYQLVKVQSSNSYAAAFMACILGFCIYAAGLIITMMPEVEMSWSYSTIGGSIVEVIAGLFFYMYNKSISQLGAYHEGLLATQNHLTAIQLSDRVSDTQKDDAYIEIIKGLMTNYSNIDVATKSS